MRIAGITIPDEKRIEFGLTALFGIGQSMAKKILSKTNINPAKKGKELTPEEENEIRRAIETIKIEGDLKRQVASNVKRLKDIKCYRGVRHTRRLPVRAQRTKTNSRTVRGNSRKTMGSGRRAVEKK